MHRLVCVALLRFLARARVSVLIAVAGIGIATASIVSVHLVSSAVQDQLNTMIPAPLARFSHFLHPTQGVDDGAHVSVASYALLRQQWRAGLHLQLQSVTPIIDEETHLAGRWVRVIGVDMLGLADAQWWPEPAAVDSHHQSSRPRWNGIWMAEELYADLVESQTGHLALDRRLASLVNGKLDLPAGVLVTDISTAQLLLGWPHEQLSYLAADFAVASASIRGALDRLLPGFSAGLPSADVEAPEQWRAVSLVQQYPQIRFGYSVLFNVSALSILALVVAWFLVYQVALSWLRRLAFIFDRLHLLGFSLQILRLYYLGLLLLLGAIAAVLGLWLGAVGAEFLLHKMTMVSEVRGLDGWVLLKAFGSGLGVAGLGALVCWHQYYRASGWRGFGLATSVSIALCVLVMLVGIVWAGSGLLGGFAAIAAVAVLWVMLLKPGLSVMRKPSSTQGRLVFKRMLTQIGAREVFWFPRDVRVCLAGLVLALGTAIGVGMMVDSFRSDFAAFLKQRLAYDLVVDGTAAELATVDRWLHDRSQSREGGSFEGSNQETDQETETDQTITVQRYQTATLRYLGAPVELRTGTFTDFELQRYGLSGSVSEPLSEPVTELSSGPIEVLRDVLVNEQFARQHNVNVGQEVMVSGHMVRIAEIVQGYGDSAPRMLADPRHPIANRELLLSSLSILAPQSDALAEQLGEQFPGLQVSQPQAIYDSALTTFDQTFLITRVLTVIALVVAAVGLYVGITAMRLNRRGSTALLHSLGLTWWENTSIDLLRGLVMGLVAIVFALPLGGVLGWLLCDVINPRAFGWSIDLKLTPRAMLEPCLWALVASIVAGVVKLGAQEEGLSGAAGWVGTGAGADSPNQNDGLGHASQT